MHELDEPPEGLPADGKAMWREIVPTLAAVGLIDRVDRWALEELCLAHARRTQFSRIIKSEGLFSAGSHAQLRQHPAVAGERAAAEAFARMASQFGLDPTGRVRLGVAKLHRKSLSAELDDVLGSVKLTLAVDATCEDVP